VGAVAKEVKSDNANRFQPTYLGTRDRLALQISRCEAQLAMDFEPTEVDVHKETVVCSGKSISPKAHPKSRAYLVGQSTRGDLLEEIYIVRPALIEQSTN
jgi:hypothetical protein